MTWTVGLILLLGILIKMITSPPSAAVAWVLKKFATHQEINIDEITLQYDGNTIEGQFKHRFVTLYNEASFFKKIYIYPGNEHLFLQPKSKAKPYVIAYKRGKKNIRLALYNEEKLITVVKQTNRKVIAYCIDAEKLHAECEANSPYLEVRVNNA